MESLSRSSNWALHLGMKCCQNTVNFCCWTSTVAVGRIKPSCDWLTAWEWPSCCLGTFSSQIIITSCASTGTDFLCRHAIQCDAVTTATDEPFVVQRSRCWLCCLLVECVLVVESFETWSISSFWRLETENSFIHFKDTVSQRLFSLQLLIIEWALFSAVSLFEFYFVLQHVFNTTATSFSTKCTN